MKHLAVHRLLVLQRALVSGAAGLVPVPYLDDVLAAGVRAGLVRRLAELRQVDVDEQAVALLVTPHASRLLAAASLGSAALRGTRFAWRRLALSLIFVRRADEALHTFQVGTLFDHYCARHHVGLGLDRARAAALRRAMDAAIRSARSESFERAFRRALRVPGAAALGLPRRVWSRLIGRRGPISAEPITLDEAMRDAASKSVVARAVESLGREVASVEKSYVGALVDAFDAAWRDEEPA
jgi:hypothetical protein